MLCKACNKTSNSKESEDCFENALDVVKQHYMYYKNALEQRDIELKQVKERNVKLNKALELLQINQQPNKRYKSQHNEPCLSNNSLHEERITSDISLTDDEPMGASNLNMAINSEQLFEISALSPCQNNVSVTSSEFVISPMHKVSPKRNNQHDMMRCLKDRNNKSLEKNKSEWHTKERNSPRDKSWASKFVKPSMSKQVVDDIKKTDKRLCLSLKKPNPSKIKQSLIQFNKSNEGNFNKAAAEDIIESSPVIINKSSIAGRSWAHRSGQNLTSNNSTNVTNKNYDSDKTNDDIVFDFSPTKRNDSLPMNLSSPIKSEPKKLKFDNDISTDCTSLPNDHFGITSNKSDSCSLVILTPSTQDIIFVDDTCNEVTDIDTMDLLDLMKHDGTDNLIDLKKYESKNIQNQQKQDLQQFKKPEIKLKSSTYKPSTYIKQEKITQNFEKNQTKNEANSTNKQQNPLCFSNNQEDEDELMPKPFLVKQEHEASKTLKVLSFKERFNIDCEFCENYFNIFGTNSTDREIEQHINKCGRHNKGDALRQNTPKDFWNPFILSFQDDDPRNEVLIDTRFKDKTPLTK